VRPHVARALVEHEARHAEELREVLAHDLRAHRVARHRVLQLQQPAELPVLDLHLLEPVDLLAEARVVVGEALVVLLHVRQVDVVVPDTAGAARERRRRHLDGGRHAEDGVVHRVLVLGRLHVRLQNEEGHREEQDDDRGVAITLERG
jgi:hypothetical protein